MRVSELPHMRELTVSLRDLALQLPHLGELPNPQKHWVFDQLPHFPISGPGATAQCLGCLFAPRSGELTLALVQDADARARRRFRWDLSGLAERKKPACLERSSPPLPKARGRLGPCGHAPAAEAETSAFQLQSAAFSVMMDLHGIPCGSLPENGRRLAFNQRA